MKIMKDMKKYKFKPFKLFVFFMVKKNKKPFVLERIHDLK